jgi:precorrin-2 dehydrogenase/sirohydrochlorin ferrochelatase
VFYPIFLQLQSREVLVVGGGPVAERKVESLLAAGASVTVVAPEITSGLAALQARNAIQVHRRNFENTDLQNVLLVVSATDDPGVQQQIAREARSQGVLVNTVDQPSLCDFVMPATVRRGDVVVAVSTGGKSPALAAALRKKLEGWITGDAARAARLLGEVRSEVHARVADADRRKLVFEGIVDSGILDWIGQCDDVTALRRVREIIEKLEHD